MLIAITLRELRAQQFEWLALRSLALQMFLSDDTKNPICSFVRIRKH